MNKKFVVTVCIVVTTFFFSCKQKQSENIPDNAIDPSVVENPVSASPEGTNSKKAPAFKFENEVHDFGTITEGEKVSYAFRFTNAGNADLLIRAAQGSCGCTVPEFPKDPVKPGSSGVINVTFDSSGKEGQQMKTVTLISNTIPNTFIISVKANVVKAS